MGFFFFCQEYEKCDRFRLWTKCDRSLYPLKKCESISHSEDHLQVLTPYTIDRESINKIFNRSL